MYFSLPYWKHTYSTIKHIHWPPNIFNSFNLLMIWSCWNEIDGFSFYPQQVAGHVALVVLKSRPPPLCLTVVLSSQDSDGVPLAERQLVWVLSFIIPQSVHRPLVHYTQFLLNACIRESDRQTVNTTNVFNQNTFLQVTLIEPGQMNSALVLTVHSTGWICVSHHIETGSTGCSPLPFLHIYLQQSPHR